MRTLKLVIEYDGTGFVGWQTQANGRSVQEEIEKVLSGVLQEPVSVMGAGRTDSGVHARGQVGSLATASTMSAASIRAALNGLLPEDIYIAGVEEVPEGFHARYSARERFYRYFISLTPSAINRRYEWFVKYDLHVPAMNRVAASILGEHDFESFCKYAAEVDHYRCTLLGSRWIESPGKLTYEIRGNRFLHGMVRALVGTMVDIGRGYTPEDRFQAIMDAHDRRKAGMAAPPHGLFLEEVVY
jgi:tRNA pseudouridine38-40 synthase